MTVNISTYIQLDLKQRTQKHIQTTIHANMTIEICDIVYISGENEKNCIMKHQQIRMCNKNTLHVCTLHKIMRRTATWHLSYQQTHEVTQTRCLCQCKCESKQVQCIAKKIGPTNSSFVWASAGMIGQGAQYESPTQYLSQQGWPSLETWLDTNDSWPSRESRYKRKNVLSINIKTRNDGVSHGDWTLLRGPLSVTVTLLV